MKQPYSIGLDIGTNSVGWAVINESFDLRKYKHQNMWGAHLFDEAQKAATRRSFRSSRRRLARRKRRVTLLQQIFNNEIQKVDPHFYLRLSESMLHLGDKNSALELDANILFADRSFTDKSYREKYPTIYHLRSDLFHNSAKQDIRLVYLAFHHIIKYRGNFLVEGGVDNVISSFDNQNLQKFMDFIDADESMARKVKAILLDRSLSRSVRKSDIIKLLQPTPDNKRIVSEAVGAAIGLKWNANKLFEDDSLEAKGEFSNKNYEERRDEIAAAIGDDRYELVETLESVYQWTIFSQFIRKDSCLSDIMVEKYDDYRQDLSDLKSLFHEFLPKESYKSFFHGDTAEFEQYNKHKYSLEDLYKSIKNHLGNVAKEDPRYQRFEKRAELGEFLARQRIRDNGAIPHQIHQYELERIIDNQAQHYPFLAQNRNKIISIFTFKLPYYIGPLKTGGNFAWSVKKKDGVIYPWNFDEMIDDEASAEKFIDRMRNNCTYLPDEEVLPKNSLLYQEYEVRNELKNVTVNGKRLSSDIQNRIVDELFNKEPSVTHKKLIKYLYDNQIYNTTSLVISGTAKEKSFASSRKSYIDFTQKVGTPITPKNQQAIEEIIKWITLFEDKKILAKKLQKYSDIFNENQLRTILKLNYSGWGRLSCKLLDGITAHTRYGEMTVIETMRRCSDNFMQIIQSDQYEFKKIIDDILSLDQRTEITYDDIKNLAGSPGIKRALWRSVKIIDEIVDIIGYEPKLISIEMARNEDEKVRTKSRYSQLEKMYKDLYGKEYNKSDIKSQLADHKDKLDRKKYYLYFLQNGKCAYTGDPLDIENDLKDCEIDHILPRSLTKDDSLDNTVLVLCKENQRKLDDYPIVPDIQNRMRPIWTSLKNAKLMSQLKFQRLTSQKQLSEDRIAGFVNRQLVETRQITKHLARMLTEKYHDSSTEVFTIRAGMSSEYRRIHDLPKCRKVNDLHHAKDAYLAAVLAQYVKIRYPKLDKTFIYGEYNKFKSTKRNITDSGSFILSSMKYDFTNTETGEIIWQSKTTRDVIDRTMRYNDCLITRKTKIGDDQFYDQTIYGKSSGKTMIARKANLPVGKYGGYSGEKAAYFAAINYLKQVRNKNVSVNEIISIPVQIYTLSKTKPDAIDEYIRKNYKQATILLPKIPINQKIEYEDNEQFIVGSSEVTNAKQLKLPYDIEYAVAIALKQGIPHITISEEQDKEDDNLRDKRAKQIEKRNKVTSGIERFWEVCTEKLSSQYQQFGGAVEKAKAANSEYQVMPMEDKIKAIDLVLAATHAGSGRVDMKKSFPKLQLPSDFGRMIGKNLDPTKITFIYESITGLHRRKLDGKSLRQGQ
jgi:CRISPR-associated protein, csn1 family